MTSLFRVDKKDIGRFKRFLLFFFHVISENIDPPESAKKHLNVNNGEDHKKKCFLFCLFFCSPVIYSLFHFSITKKSGFLA